MAVVKTPSDSSLRMRFQTGTDPQSGDPVYRTKSLTNVKADAVDQDIYDVSQAFASLSEYSLIAVERVDYADLADDGL